LLKKLEKLKIVEFKKKIEFQALNHKDLESLWVENK
jgi:hypothetical protein